MRRWSAAEALALRNALRLTKRAFAARLGVTHRSITNWETGRVTISGFSLSLLDQALQTADDDAQQRFTEVLAELPRQGGPDRLDESAGPERLEWVLAHPEQVDLIAVAQLREQIQDLDERYEHAPSTSLLAAAGQHHAQITYLSGHCRTGRIRRELTTARAESAILMGQLVWDASLRRDHTTAAAYFDEAIDAARQVGDTVTEANAHLRKSYIALYGYKDPTSGLHLAQEAARLSGTTSRVISGLGLLHVGEARAMLQERTACESALSDAEGQFAQVNNTDAAIELYSPSQLGRVAGSCFLFLNQPHTAQQHLEQSSHLAQGPTKAGAIVHANLAIACVRQRQLDEAIGHLHQAIDLAEQTRGAGGLNVTFAAGREMAPWRDQPAVREIHDRLLALMT